MVVVRWVKALDMLLDKLRVAGLDFTTVFAIIGLDSPSYNHNHLHQHHHSHHVLDATEYMQLLIKNGVQWNQLSSPPGGRYLWGGPAAWVG